MQEHIERILRQIEGLKNQDGNFWNVPRLTGEFLNLLAKIQKVKNVLEIGTSNGYSGIFLASALPADGRLYTVESHEERFQMAKENFSAAGLDRFIIQIKGHAPEILLETPDLPQFDFVFLDATKMEHVSYLKGVLPLTGPNALIIADNMISHREEMQIYYDYALSLATLESVLLPIGTGLLLSRKKQPVKKPDIFARHGTAFKPENRSVKHLID